MLSVHEARIRACAIWGSERLIALAPRADGGVDVEVVPATRWTTDGDGLGIGEWGYAYHQLNDQGEPVCHAACQPDPRDR
jgi:hypothetical protein